MTHVSSSRPGALSDLELANAVLRTASTHWLLPSLRRSSGRAEARVQRLLREVSLPLKAPTAVRRLALYAPRDQSMRNRLQAIFAAIATLTATIAAAKEGSANRRFVTNSVRDSIPVLVTAIYMGLVQL